MRYFLTGATGFIGGYLARQLVADGHEVVALVRTPAKALALQELGVELAKGDVTEPATLPGPMKDVDGVFHLAAWYRVGSPSGGRAAAINVEGTRNVLRAAGAAGVPRTVYTSTLAIFGDTGGRRPDESYRLDGPWLSEYDRTKWRAHYHVAVPMSEAGLPLVIVQPGIVYGPGDGSNVGMVLRDYLRGRLPVIPTQGGCWSFVADTARGHIQAMERGVPGESYILAGPCAMWREVLTLAAAITGIPAPRLPLPPWLARLSSWLLRPVSRVVRLPPTYHPETLRVAAGATYFGDDGKARRALDWDPRPLRDGLATTLEAEMAELGVTRS